MTDKCEKCGSTDLSFVPVAEFKIKYCNNCEHEEKITGMVSIGNGEKCPYCDLIQGKDFDDPLPHFMSKHEKEFTDAIGGK